jgi:hypothetical protein
MVSPRAARGLDGLRIEETPMHYAASVLARLGIGPGKLISDALAVATQPDVVDPTKTIKVIRANRPGHGVPPMLSAGNMVTVMWAQGAASYRAAVKLIR